ncbi:hypothetical protein WAK64_18115 [Bacillus spongiae]|uniref:Integrase n=1 Tax=Bacillus spongiae TaxID=2683610 RepID=A0ABU8HIH3_9BACI
MKRKIDLSSIYVYQAVLEHDIQSIDEFFKWIQKYDMKEFSTWTPNLSE